MAQRTTGGARSASGLPSQHFEPSRCRATGMRGLEDALTSASAGTGQVQGALLTAGFLPGLPGLTKVLSKLSKGGETVKALEVFQTLPLLGLTPDTAICNAAISACDRGGPWEQALRIFDGMGQVGVERDIITFCATIGVVSWSKKWELAVELFNRMLAEGVSADAWVCSCFLRALERGGQWRLAEGFFLRMCRASGLPLQALLEPRPTAGAAAAVGYSLKSLSLSSGISSPRSSISMDEDLIALLAEIGGTISNQGQGGSGSPQRPGAANRAANALLSNSWSPNSSPTRQQQQHGQQLQPPTTEEEEAVMRLLSVPAVRPNTICCNVMLQSYARAQPTQWQKAVRQLEAMHEWSGGAAMAAPDVISYNIIIKACTRAHQPRAALQVYDSMLARGVPPTIQVLVMLISCAGEDEAEGAFDVMTEVLDRFERSGLPLNAAFSTAYRAALHKQQARSEQQGMAPQTDFQAAPKELSLRNGAGQQRMQQQGHESPQRGSPHRQTSSDLRSGSTFQGGSHQLSSGFQEPTDAFNAALQLLANAADNGQQLNQQTIVSQAKFILQQMQGRLQGAPAPCAASFQLLVTIFERCGRGGDVLATYDAMRSMGITPSREVLDAVVSACIRSGCLQMAVEAVTEAHCQGVAAVPSTQQALSDALHLAKRLQHSSSNMQHYSTPRSLHPNCPMTCAAEVPSALPWPNEHLDVAPWLTGCNSSAPPPVACQAYGAGHGFLQTEVGSPVRAYAS